MGFGFLLVCLGRDTLEEFISRSFAKRIYFRACEVPIGSSQDLLSSLFTFILSHILKARCTPHLSGVCPECTVLGSTNPQGLMHRTILKYLQG